MASTAAVLSILVKAEGIARSSNQIRGLQGDLTKADRAADRMGGTVDTSSRKSGKAFGVLTSVGKKAALGVAGVGIAGIAGGKQLLSLASNAEETASKFKIVFGRETPRAIRELDRFSKVTGTSKFALREQAAGLQALIRPMGLSTKASAGMSVGMTKLATDLASFNNTSVKDAIVALQSGLVGEAEPMRRFGVQLSATRVQAFAYANGIAKQGKELTAAQKAQASYGIILKDTKLAQGDAERTSGSFANQLKRLKAQVTDVATELGMRLIPVASSVLKWMTDLIAKFQGGKGAGDQFKQAIQTAREALEDLGPTFETAKTTIAGAIEILTTVWNTFGDDVIGRAKDMLGTIKGFVQGITKFLGGLTDFIAGVFTGDWGRAWDGIKQMFEGVWKLMITIIDAAWETIKGIVKLGMTGLITVIRGFTQPLVDAGQWVINRIADGISTITGAFGQVGGWIKNRVVEFVRAVPDAYIDAGKWVTNRIAEGIQTVTNALGSVGGWVKNRVVEFIQAIPDGFVGAGTWIINRVADGIKTVTDALAGVGGWIKNRVQDAAEAAKDGFESVGEWIIGRIVAGVKGGANAFRTFINWIIRAINKIPAVPDIPEIPAFAEGGKFGGRAQMLANGGVVRKPMAIVGEEAPRHPEFVIPTNPAYRSRAMGLYSELGNKLGVSAFRGGGRMGGPSLGDIVGAAKDAAGFPASLLEKGASFILDKLPGVGDLPGWLKGTGKWVLENVGKWIKDKVGSLLGGSGGGIGGVLGGLAANWPVVEALAGRFGLTMTSGFRPGDDGWHGKNRARDYSNSSAPTPEMMRFGQTIAQLMGSKLLELIYTPMGFSIKNGQRTAPFAQADHFDHVHVAMALGGLLHRYGWVGGKPVLGSFAQGTGFVPQTGPYMLHRGEAVTPAGGVTHVHHVYLDGRELDVKIDSRVVENGRQDAGAWRAGSIQ